MNSAVHQAVTGHFLTRVPMDNYRGGEKKINTHYREKRPQSCITRFRSRSRLQPGRPVWLSQHCRQVSPLVCLTAAAQMTKHINHTARKVCLINHP